MTAKIQIVPKDGLDCHAGAKAPRDAAAVAERLGFRRLCVRRSLPPVAGLAGLYWLFWLVKSLWYLLRIPRGACVFVQCTGTMFTGRMSVRMLALMRKLKRARLVTLVHDVDVLRGQVCRGCREGLDRRMRQFVRASDILIVHNSKMREWFEGQGVSPDRLVELGLFDYLTLAVPDQSRHLSNEIVLAGNLSPDKSEYLARLPEVPELKWNLYGPGYDKTLANGANVEYCGCHAPEELPNMLKGSFGLVWDGDSIETCGGRFGEYLRFNNPHKLSLYLAAGLPVIVWSQSALAEFVRSNHLGLCVNSLRDIPAALSGLNADAYCQMCRNAQDVSARLRSGVYLEAAIEEALRRFVRDCRPAQ